MSIILSDMSLLFIGSLDDAVDERELQGECGFFFVALHLYYASMLGDDLSGNTESYAGTICLGSKERHEYTVDNLMADSLPVI